MIKEIIVESSNEKLKIKIYYSKLDNLELIALFKSEYLRIMPNDSQDFYRKSELAPSLYIIKKRLKQTWNGILYIIGKSDEEIKFIRRSKKELIDLMRKAVREMGRIPNTQEICKYCTSDVIKDTFGSYQQGFIEAGFDNVNNFTIKKIDKSKEELLEEYVDFCNKLGRVAKQQDIIDNKEMHSPCTYIRYFGCFTNLKRAAGFSVNYIDKRRFKKDNIKELLLEEVEKKGRKLTCKELSNNKNLPSLQTVLNYFNTSTINDVWKELGLC